MSKSLTDEQVRKTSQLVESELTPRIKKMLAELNKVLAKDNICAGVELTWYYDFVQTKEETNEIKGT